MADWPAKKNAAFTVTFPIYDADGDLVSAAASLDSEVSKDGGTFADVSPGEATEIATSSGIYTLALSATEMNADIVATITKTVTAGAKTAVNVMYTATRQLVDLAYPATSGRSLQVETDGHVHADLKEWLGVAPNALQSGRVDAYGGALAANVITAAAINTGAITAAKFAAGAIDAAAIAANAIAATKIATGAITAAKFAAGAIDAAAIANGAIDAATFAAGAIDAAAIGTGAIDADAIAADAIGSSELAATAATEIADAVFQRDMDQVEAAAPVHSLATAVLKAVSRIRDNAGTLEIYRTNGTTVHASQTVTVDASLDPIDELTIAT
jgi:hypothetical protein